MNKILIAAIILLASFNTIHAQATTTQTPALKIDYELGPIFENGSEEAKETYLNSLNTALAMVKGFQPVGDNLFNWKGSKTVLANKTFEIYYTSSDDKVLTDALKNNGTLLSADTDALTLLMRDQSNSDLSIFLCILADKIFFDSHAKERTDGFTRLAVALAHEIYGNTQMYLKQDLSPTATTKLPSRKQAEINAFTAGINFINKVLESFKSGILSTYPNKTKLVSDFTKALTREKAGLEYWKTASDNTK